MLIVHQLRVRHVLTAQKLVPALWKLCLMVRDASSNNSDSHDEGSCESEFHHTVSTVGEGWALGALTEVHADTAASASLPFPTILWVQNSLKHITTGADS